MIYLARARMSDGSIAKFEISNAATWEEALAMLLGQEGVKSAVIRIK